MDTTVTAERPQSQANTFVMAAIVVVVGVLATTLPQTQVLARLPLQNLLKNELHVSRSANAAFFFLAGLPWYFKPVVGILTVHNGLVTEWLEYYDRATLLRSVPNGGVHARSVCPACARKMPGRLLAFRGEFGAGGARFGASWPPRLL